MNKKLIGMITSALVIGAASTALANPFSDVPADHWAYDAIDQLAADGVIEGYNDGTFAGDKAITRYEMAQIVARAMANCEGADAADKATVDKLAAEFSAELDSLGVRVDAIEKKVAGIKDLKIGGSYRIRYQHEKAYYGESKPGHYSGFDQRLILSASGKVNDKMSFYTDMFAIDNNKLGETNIGTYGSKFHNNKLVNAFLTYNMGKTDLTVGRYYQKLGAVGWLSDTSGEVDGAKVEFATDKWSGVVGYADFGVLGKTTGNLDDKLAAGSITQTQYEDRYLDKALFTQVNYHFTPDYSLSALYMKEDKDILTNREEVDLWGAGFSAKVAKHLVLAGDYYKNMNAVEADQDSKKGAEGWGLRLSYKGHNLQDPGSWGMYVERLSMDNNLIPAANLDNMTTDADFVNGKKFWGIGATITVAKNTIFNAYASFDRKDLTKPATGESFGGNYYKADFMFFF